MHDHRLAVDVGQRLAGQAGRGHARGDEDDRIGQGNSTRQMRQKRRRAPAYTCCQVRRKAANQSRAGAAVAREPRELPRSGVTRRMQTTDINKIAHGPADGAAADDGPRRLHQRDLRAADSRQAAVSLCRAATSDRRRQAGRARRGAAAGAARQSRPRRRARPTPRSASPAMPSRRAPAPRSARRSTASSAARRARSPASPIPTA